MMMLYILLRFSLVLFRTVQQIYTFLIINDSLCALYTLYITVICFHNKFSLLFTLGVESTSDNQHILLILRYYIYIYRFFLFLIYLVRYTNMLCSNYSYCIYLIRLFLCILTGGGKII